jgi:hypothetical protein
MTVPTLKINVDTPSAAGAAGYLVVGDATYGKIGTATIYGTNAYYVDRSTDVRSFSTTRGMTSRADPFFVAAPGTAIVMFDNLTRAYDPNTGTDIIPGRAINIQMTWAGTTYNVFTGTVDQWKPSYPAYGHDQVTEAACNDGLSILSQLNVTQPADAELTGTRVNRYLNLVSWPAGTRNVAAGTTMMPAVAATSSALAAIQLAADSEFGQFYVAANGYATLRSRAALVTDTRSTISQATFGDQGSELRYSDIQPLPTDKSSIINIVDMVYNDANATVRASDRASFGRYGPRTLTQPLQVRTADSGVAANIANVLVDLYKTAIDRFATITVRPGRDPTNLWPQVLGRQIGDRITVKRTPLTGTRISKDCFVVGIAHDVKASTTLNDWTTTFTLMDASQWPNPPLIIGTGQVGVDQIWF